MFQLSDPTGLFHILESAQPDCDLQLAEGAKKKSDGFATLWAGRAFKPLAFWSSDRVSNSQKQT
jgi:hypothetical protein